MLIEQGYDVHQNRAGECGEDFAAYKGGKRFSVEVKNTQGLLHSMTMQCKRNAGKHDRLLMWHPSHWDMPGNLWVVFIWRNGEKGRVESWYGNGGASVGA